MADEFFDIPSDVIKEAETAAKFTLTIPETAREDKSGNRYFFEAGTIRSAHSSQYDSENGKITVYVVQTVINAEGSGRNVGRPLTAFIRINSSAIKAKRESKQLTMSRMGVHKLNTLFRSLDIEGDLEGGGYSKALLMEYFPPDTKFEKEQSPLVNRNVYFEVKIQPAGTLDKKGREVGPELTKFVPNIG